MPFTKEQFLNVFKEYNLAVFPIQILFLVFAILSIFLLTTGKQNRNKVINSVLAFFWLWIGVVYHFIFFSPINKAAYFFSIMFIVQACIFIYFGIVNGKIDYELRKDFRGIAGWLMIIYALAIYPVLGIIAGHGYPYQPTFGLPCPTTIFTFGILLFTKDKLKWYFLIIPFLWSLIGFTAAVKLGVYEDIGLLIAGLTAMSLLLRKK